MLAALGLLSAPAIAAPAAADTKIFAGGGTPVTNGIFFPGTAITDGTDVQGAPPVAIDQGNDFEFINLDEAAVGNGHKIISFKRKNGRPLFNSKLLSRPGSSSLVITSHLKPGVYTYFCPVHSGMLGRLEIV